MIPLDQGIEVMRPSDDTIASRLSAPIVSFDIDTKKISFERYSMNILREIYKNINVLFVL